LPTRPRSSGDRIPFFWRPEFGHSPTALEIFARYSKDLALETRPVTYLTILNSINSTDFENSEEIRARESPGEFSCTARKLFGML
jgi:hypothetical protein